MPKPSARQRLADLLLGQPVADFIAERRTAGARWHVIAADLRAATDGEIDISGEAIRQWHARSLVEDVPA